MREPDESEESKDSGSEAIEAAAQDLIQAIQAQDVKAAAKALQAAYDICESSDSESDSEIEPHSYDSQKED